MNFEKALESFPFNSGYSRVKESFGTNRKSERVLFELWGEVDGVIEGLKPEFTYTCEDLCGPDIWARYARPGQRRALGIALHHLVQQGALPLICVTQGSSNLRYRLDEAAMRIRMESNSVAPPLT